MYVCVNVYACVQVLYSVVNIGEVTGMASFHSELFPACLALTSEAGLVIGTVDDIQVWKERLETVKASERQREKESEREGGREGGREGVLLRARVS